jgi:hypothetical protein
LLRSWQLLTQNRHATRSRFRQCSYRPLATGRFPSLVAGFENRSRTFITVQHKQKDRLAAASPQFDVLFVQTAWAPHPVSSLRCALMKNNARAGSGAGATITSGERDKGQAIAIAAGRLRLRHQPTKEKRASTEPSSGKLPGSGVAETLLTVRLSIKA